EFLAAASQQEHGGAVLGDPHGGDPAAAGGGAGDEHMPAREFSPVLRSRCHDRSSSNGWGAGSAARIRTYSKVSSAPRGSFLHSALCPPGSGCRGVAGNSSAGLAVSLPVPPEI